MWCFVAANPSVHTNKLHEDTAKVIFYIKIVNSSLILHTQNDDGLLNYNKMHIFYIAQLTCYLFFKQFQNNTDAELTLDKQEEHILPLTSCHSPPLIHLSNDNL